MVGLGGWSINLLPSVAVRSVIPVAKAAAGNFNMHAYRCPLPPTLASLEPFLRAFLLFVWPHRACFDFGSGVADRDVALGTEESGCSAGAWGGCGCAVIGGVCPAGGWGWECWWSWRALGGNTEPEMIGKGVFIEALKELVFGPCDILTKWL